MILILNLVMKVSLEVQRLTLADDVVAPTVAEAAAVHSVHSLLTHKAEHDARGDLLAVAHLTLPMRMSNPPMESVLTNRLVSVLDSHDNPLEVDLVSPTYLRTRLAIVGQKMFGSTPCHS